MKLKASNIFLEGYEDYFIEQVMGACHCMFIEVGHARKSDFQV